MPEQAEKHTAITLGDPRTGHMMGQYFTPIFRYWPTDDECNYIIFRNLSFAAPTPNDARVLGTLADVSGFTDAFDLQYVGEWSLVSMGAGPYLFKTALTGDLAMGIAIIKGPMLDRHLAGTQS